MQPNPNSNNRSALASASHAKSYDPSEAYRAKLMPPPPPVNTEMPSQDVPATNIDPRTGVVKRIPQFYYPRYGDSDNPPVTQPRETNPNFSRPPPPAQRPVPNEVPPYVQPAPWSGAPYVQDPYYPYGAPYLIPITTNVSSPDQVPVILDQSKADVIAAHQQDADLSRLEVYHFTPKQNGFGPAAAPPGQPIIQYHVYPQAPVPGASLPGMPQPQQPQQQFPPYPHPWPRYPPNVPPYVPDPSQQEFPYIETKARSSQTDAPSTKSRAVSPIHVTSIEPVYDDDGYPYIHHRTAHTDRYNLQTGRVNRRFYDSNRSTPVADCRCLDCQRERTKILNYYPD